MTFKDHFSSQSDHYQQFRPGYPDSLFTYLSSIAPTNTCAWDCATGTGQAANQLAGYFKKVIATDASEEQIEQAAQNPVVNFQISPAENTSIQSSSIDLITVAQALHWFDIKRFFVEADRVLKPAGVLAIWSYNLLRIQPDIDALINRFYKNTLEPYWPAERHMIEQGYCMVDLPYPETDTNAFRMHANWDLDQLLGYLGTWSAVQRYRSATGENPLLRISGPLASVWGNPAISRRVTWPLTLRVCIKP